MADNENPRLVFDEIGADLIAPFLRFELPPDKLHVHCN